jgi:hypothetical protein
MAVAGLTLPALTEADPEVVGEGSIDPLGLAQIADRLANLLAPGVRARMIRIRLLTAAAVGALACDDLFDYPSADAAVTPSTCFEWLVLEAFARSKNGALDESGVPGSSKVQAVLAQQKRLAARNYLKSPSVTGFTGVYLPLAGSFGVLDPDRRPGKHIDELTIAWELDQDKTGFTSGKPGLSGRRLRDDIRYEVRRSLDEKQCACAPRSRLWASIASSLHPTRPGPREAALLRQWLTSLDEPARRELALAVANHAGYEWELVKWLLEGQPSAETRTKLEAVARYERVSRLLTYAFRHLLHTSYVSGVSKPINAAQFSGDETLAVLLADLPTAVGEARERLDRVEPGSLALFDERVTQPFGDPLSGSEFVEVVMRHHEQVQAGKFPGKRPWFEALGSGWVVRPQYQEKNPVNPLNESFVHPYRLAALRQFMVDLQP